MAVRDVVLMSDPHVGFAIGIDGQEYVYLGKAEAPRVLSDGQVLDRLWSTRCKSCDDPFECGSSEKITYMTRRCVDCRPKR